MDLLKEQLWLEEEGHLEAKAKYLRSVGKEGEGLLNTMGESIVAICAPVLAEVYQEWLEEVASGRLASKKTWFRKLDVKPIGVAVVTLRTILQGVTYGSTCKNPTLTSMVFAVYNAIYMENSYQQVCKASKGRMVAGTEASAKKAFNKNLSKELETKVKFAERKKLIDYARKTYTEFELEEPEDKYKMGLCLVEFALKMKAPLIRGSKDLQPLFKLDYEGKRRKVIALSDALLSYLVKYKQFKSGNAVDLKPMVVPPLNWSGMFGGGYRSLKCQLKAPLIRTTKTRVYKDSDISPLIYKACNAIQATPWSINKEIYAVMRYCYNNELGIAGIPIAREDTPLPYKPEEEWAQMSPEERRDFGNIRRSLREEGRAHQSKVIAFGCKMAMCMKFIKYDKLYFPHSFDFRGRIYPVNTPVNPQSDKYGQALLTFHKKKKLGESGVGWWKIHGANCWGLDKEPYDVRIAWVDDNKDKLLSWAANPLKHREEWAEADDPWNFLAFAFEYARAHSKGEPEEDFESCLPVKLDATSSGLQHYSAIFRDNAGALATNLTADKNRKDIYGIVAEKAKLSGVSELERGEKEGLKRQVLMSVLRILNRKHTKPATMCLPYGITEYGSITDTIELADAGAFGDYVGKLDAPTKYKYCAWIARRILTGVSDTVQSAVVGMQWLKDAEKAMQAVNEDNVYIKFFTRLGFPSQQTYNKEISKRLKTSLGMSKIKVVLRKQTPIIDKRKSQSSIAPNFIHSMDATHLLMTALKAYDMGIEDFSFIHDSFGVHACDTEDFSRYIRETFITLYKGDVLSDLRDQWLDQFPDADIPEVPYSAYGTFDIEEVIKSRYFFS